MPDNKNPFLNASGYPDPTAYHALKPIIREEAELDGKVNFLIKVLKYIIAESGFELLDSSGTKGRGGAFGEGRHCH